MKERKRGGGGQEKRVEGQREGPPPAIGSIAAGGWGGEGGWPQSLRCFEASPPGSPGESDTGVEPV